MVAAAGSVASSARMVLSALVCKKMRLGALLPPPMVGRPKVTVKVSADSLVPPPGLAIPMRNLSFSRRLLAAIVKVPERPELKSAAVMPAPPLAAGVMVYGIDSPLAIGCDNTTSKIAFRPSATESPTAKKRKVFGPVGVASFWLTMAR